MRRLPSRSHVSSEFIASHAPLRTGLPQSLESTMIDLTVSDSDDDGEDGIIDLTDDNVVPSFKKRKLPISQLQKPPSSSGPGTGNGYPNAESTLQLSASRTLPVHPKSPVDLLALPRASKHVSVLPNTSGAATKISPRSLPVPRNETPQSSRLLPASAIRNGTPLVDSEEEEDGDVFDNHGPPISPDTPSKQVSRKRGGSQKSISSIGTSSPLFTRIREQRSRNTLGNSESRLHSQSPREVVARQSAPLEKAVEQPTIEDLEESLRTFDQRMKDDHALTVRWLLSDAKEAAKNTPKPFMDKVSPFTGMKGAQLRPGEPIPEGAVTEKLESYVVSKSSNKAKLVKSYSVIVAKTIMDDVPKVPKYSSHTIARRNHLTADDEQLRFIPYLGDNDGSTKKVSGHKRLVKELEEAYKNDRVISSREAERATQIRGYFDSWLSELAIGCNEQTLQRYILQHQGHILGKKERVIKMLLKALGGPLEDVLEERADAFATAFQSVFDMNVMDVVLPETHLREMIKSLKPESDTPSGRLSTFTDLTCLICGVVCCQSHGDYAHNPIFHSDDSEATTNGEREPADWEYSHQPLMMKHEDILRKHDIRVSNMEQDGEYRTHSRNPAPCSDNCYMRIGNSNDKYEAWNQYDIDSLKEILVSVTNRDHQACSISYAMGWPCWQIYHEIRKYEKRGGREIVEKPPLGRLKTQDRPSWYNNKLKTLHRDWMEATTAHLHQERCQTNPCAHEGPCVRGCPCYNSNILCESMCGCPDDCPRKFTGCSCVSSGVNCNSESCICVQMNRECGPQCGSCGAVQRINPANKYEDDLFATGCQNIVLQRGVPKRLMIGESQLEGVGFGLYVGEPVQKGGFLSEYAGEVVSYAEADRRGIIYDRKYSSFLFDLNSEWVIDAARLGNKTRFINHADNDKDGLNCEAKIVLVNGEHRIKFVALRDLKVGEELLFNYGKKFAEKHGLSKKLPKVKEAGKKGVLVGKEALDALDGMDPENRVSRKKMTAIRGGRGGVTTGRNKARKTAPPKKTPAVTADQVSAVQDSEFQASAAADEEEDEDEDEEDAHARRRKRKITRPARYTR